MKAFLFEFCKDKVIDRILRPGISSSIVESSRSNRHLESPMRPIDRALPDPFLQNGDFARAHRLGLALGVLRHQIVRVAGFDSFDQLALIRLTGDDSVAMAFAFLHCPFGKVKPQACLAHFRVRAMTTETTVCQDGLYILVEIEVSRDVMGIASDGRDQ